MWVLFRLFSLFLKDLEEVFKVDTLCLKYYDKKLNRTILYFWCSFIASPDEKSFWFYSFDVSLCHFAANCVQMQIIKKCSELS